MAKNTPKNKDKEQIARLLDKQPEPPFFKVGRDAVLQLSKLERDLFTDMEETESGNYIISGLTKQVTELDFTAFTFAIGQILYNQSYKSGNEDLNSGISRKRNNKISQQIGAEYYTGEIVVSLNELCRLAYGAEPTTEIKKKMAALIETFDKIPVKIKFPNGDTRESRLCATMEKYTREKDGAILYKLYLNPIFGSRIISQYGELPQDVIAMLDKSCKEERQRKQAAHYLLIRWLSIQDKRQPHKLYIETLIHELRMEAYFKENRGKAEKQLLSVCNTMVGIGILRSYDTEYTIIGRRRRIRSITFLLNPHYNRLDKGTEATPNGVNKSV